MPKFTKEEKEKRSILEITKELGEVYFIREDADTEQKKLRSEFFEAATTEATKEPLATKTITVVAETEEKAKTRAELYHPGWQATSCVESNDEYKILLTEDPEYRSYTFVNPEDNFVYSRQVARGSALLDEERLQEEDLDLWIEITEWEHYELLARAMFPDFDEIPRFEVEEQLQYAEALYPTLFTRAVRPLKDLEPEILAKLQPYIYEGSKQIKLAKPRKAKEEERSDT